MKRGVKKAEVAMEFLMTYGWVILVALVVIVGLVYFGVLKPEKFLPEKCIIYPGSGLYCEDFTADDLNDITLRIKNVMNYPINIFNISIKTGLDDPGKAICRNFDQVTIPKGSFTNFFVGEDCDLQAGDKIKGEISILYNKNGLDRTARGTLTSYVKAAGGEEEEYYRDICQNAENGNLCDGLYIAFGENFREKCCNEFGLCC